MKMVKSKYFDKKEPSFLTWSEKEQIRCLHEQDEIEWSPDRLAECFPALPQTILKILKTKWKPNNINTINKYDKSVIDNWEKFKKGDLALDPMLAQHLNKFKDRKIDFEALQSLAHKFVKDKPVFPQPKNKLFISLLQDDDNDDDAVKLKKIKSNDDDDNLLYKITDGNANKNNETIIQQKKNNIITNNKIKQDQQYTTFDEFLEHSIDKLSKTNTNNNDISLENKLLIEEYKKKIDLVDSSITSTTSTTMIDDNNVELPCENDDDDDDDDNSTSIAMSNLHIDENSPTTGIIERKIIESSSSSSEDDYPRFIKIPKGKAKEGVTFRVQDKYYDWDGEFLYRVPVLKS
ncbi:putative neugrin-like protein DDB_G0288135 isoform X2 [Aphidius gifuensis]|nr:putative neugrin-like protein DDB_G0288135 isoform X2 [Aphidius gifuensis]